MQFPFIYNHGNAIYLVLEVAVNINSLCDDLLTCFACRGTLELLLFLIIIIRKLYFFHEVEYLFTEQTSIKILDINI